MNKIIEITDKNFKEKVLQKIGFILIDFWAPWCNPCKILAPILEEISQEYNKLTIGKLNIEEHPDTAPIYSVRSIPTLLLFNNGQVISTKVGALSKLQLKDFLDEHIN